MTDSFDTRFDMARWVLEKKYRWAKITLRNLTPIARDEGTLAVDKYLRLYHGPQADAWSDQEFVAALWHEVNHLLRHHPDRLAHLAQKHSMDPMMVNVAADLEINDDLLEQDIALPKDCLTSEMFGHDPFQSAEAHFAQFVETREQQKEPQPGPGEPGDEEADGQGIPGDEPGPTMKPKTLPSNDPKCGSASGGNSDGEEPPPPDEADMGKLEKAIRDQAEAVVKEFEERKEAGRQGLSQQNRDGSDGESPGGADIYASAITYLGRSTYDWRIPFAVEVRNAIDQRSDEAEEYTFRRRSRRQAALGDEFILPGSYRPIPNLMLLCDVSGSMDRSKLTAAMIEVIGILERLAIPEFMVYPWNTEMALDQPVRVSTVAHIKEAFERRGGGTDMQAGVNRMVKDGAEVIIVLTDNETRWKPTGPHGVPVIIGGINRHKAYPAPSWARVIDVAEDFDYDRRY